MEHPNSLRALAYFDELFPLEPASQSCLRISQAGPSTASGRANSNARDRFHPQSNTRQKKLNASAQQSLFTDIQSEEQTFLKSQLITYIGNKRALLPFIDTGIRYAKEKIGKQQIDFLDLFSGSGVVARMARQHSRMVHCNDLELYSEVVNSCYQTNAGEVDAEAIATEIERVRREVRETFLPGFIAELYAPQDDHDIKRGERVFYTRRNATFLDTFCRVIEGTPKNLRPYVLAPVLSQASMYANTSGVFKGFYKNKEGVGQFGGTFKNALTRIKRNIEVQAPIFSNFNCNSIVHKADANALIRELEPVDVAYFDPPYNQHPYGSNYFMLNLICDYRRPEEVSSVSGIPTGWNRSLYNKAQHAEAALFDAIENVKAKFVLVSYNSEGFVAHDRFLSELVSLGEVCVMDTKYNTFRGCRNLAGRDMHVTENLYLIDKR
jgi:adenine-specific DNA-methyltransferase